MSLLQDVVEYADEVRAESKEISVTDSYKIACELFKIGDFRRANGLDDTGVWSEESTALENIAGILSEIQAQLENKQK
tara:strand:+ start:258 stop:491 length:234 start_codon:yes stop_codon:yes gene_type:complete